jgi:signal transduction histidine kinase
MLSVLPFTGKAQVVMNGKADLSDSTFTGTYPIKLRGEWEFYWKKLLGPEDFKVNQNPEFIKVPGQWNREENYDVLGYATYRLNLKLPRSHSGLSLYFPIINSSAKIWINGNLAEESGKVSTDAKTYIAKLGNTIVSIPEYVTDVEIIIQVANYTYFSAGISYAPQLGRSSSILQQMNRSHGVENFFAGSLIAMFIYQFILYFLYHRGQPYLWLSLICLGVALRAMIVHGGSFLLPNLIPSVSWEYWKKIEFGSVYAIIAFFPLYVRTLFIDQAPRRPIIFFVSIAIALCAVVIVTPQYTYGKLLDVGHVSLLLTFIYAVYSISKAWKAGNQDAHIILFGVLASFPFILLEILKNSVFISLNLRLMYMVELGVLVFLLFQIYLLANHYVTSYKNLETMNLDLEKMVEERTGQLVTANTVKDRLLSVMSHDIKSPLNSLRGILQIYNQGHITQDEFAQYAKHIESDLNKTNLLVDNILFWTASQLKGIQVKLESFDLQKLIEENVQLFTTIAENKKVILRYDHNKHFTVKSDRNISNFVIRNLIANAIKFSFEGGIISIDVVEKDESLVIKIKDTGVGMDSQALQNILAPKNSLTTTGTGNEKGTGLGLALCREYLKKVNGHLVIESTKGKGSTFSMVLPLS